MVFPVLAFPLKYSKPHAVPSLPSCPSSPVAGWRGELEAQKVRITICYKNNLLETVMREENSTSNNIKKSVEESQRILIQLLATMMIVT